MANMAIIGVITNFRKKSDPADASAALPTAYVIGVSSRSRGSA